MTKTLWCLAVLSSALLLSLSARPAAAQTSPSDAYCIFERITPHGPMDEVASRNDWLAIFRCLDAGSAGAHYGLFPVRGNWGSPIPQNMSLGAAQSLADFILVTANSQFGQACCQNYPIYSTGTRGSMDLGVVHNGVLPGWSLYDSGGRCCETQVQRAVLESDLPPRFPSVGDCRQVRLYGGGVVLFTDQGVFSRGAPITITPPRPYPPITIASLPPGLKTGLPTTVPGLAAPPTYLGCYVDRGDQGRALPTFRGDPPRNSVEACAAVCAGRGYVYAGVEHGTDCWCTSRTDFSRFGGSTQCNTPCPGNSRETCGGYLAVSVFRVISPPVAVPGGRPAPPAGPGPGSTINAGGPTDSPTGPPAGPPTTPDSGPIGGRAMAGAGPVGPNDWKLVAMTSDPGHKSGRSGSGNNYEAYSIAIGKYHDEQHFNGASCSFDLSMEMPPAVLRVGQTVDLHVRGSFSPSGSCKGGRAAARIEGPGVRIVQARWNGSDSWDHSIDSNEGAIAGFTASRPQSPVTSSDVIYRITVSANFPDQFSILQIGTGTGVAGEFKYCKGGVCKTP